MQLAGAFSLSESIVVLLSAHDGEFLDVNPAFERILGYPRAAVLGRLPIEIGLWPDIEVRASLWAQIRAEQRVVGLPTRVQAADGRILSVLLCCELIVIDGESAVFCLAQQVFEAAADAQDRQGEIGAPDDGERRAWPRTGADTSIDSSYRALYWGAAEGIYRSLPGSGFIDVNPALAHMLGFQSPAQLLLAHGRHAGEVYADPGRAAQVHELLQRDGRIHQLRSRVRRCDGTLIWVSENAHAVCDDSGQVLFYEGTAVDITARIDAEQALQQSEALYRVLVDNSRDGVFLIQRGRIVFANRAMAQILGCTAEDLTGRDYMDFVAPEDRAAQLQRRLDREDGGEAPQNYEIRLIRADGSAIVCVVRANAVDYHGDIASTGTLRDITDERRHQLATREAERRYHELFEHSPIGLFRTSLQGDIIDVNPALAQMFGYRDSAEFKAEVSHMRDVYADPHERTQLMRRVLEHGGFSDYRTRISVRNGRRLWVNCSVLMIRPEDGGTAQLTGSVQDITERHDMEQALQRSERIYRTLIEHSQVGVFISRGEHYIYVNHSLTQMLGYTEDELLALPIARLIAPEYLAVSTERRQRIESDQTAGADFENCYLHKDGSRVYVTVSVGTLDLDGVPHLSGTVRDITRHREVEQRLRFSATHDPLTGLPNRALFQQRLAERMHETRAGALGSYAVLFLDLDGFKWINDSLGHGAGDRLLLQIAQQLARALDGDTLLARYGGDEFTLLPYGPCDRRRATTIAQRVLDVFDAPFDIGVQSVFSSASVGIVLGSAVYESPDQILRDADTAMYRAKASGKSNFAVFDEEMHSRARTRFQIETDIRQALERGEFRVHYQPVVALDDRRILGCEALVRWQHPQHGLLLPEHFLEVAEETGMIADLDDWVLRQACRQLVQWQGRYPAHAGLTVNVNVDARQLTGRSLMADLAGILDHSGLAADRLRLEVTEIVFRNGRVHAAERLNALKQMGVGLVVDDFGTGYSSLDSFASSPFDALKIDRSFIQDMTSNPRHRAIVRTIIGFAEDLGLELTAEGVEQEGQCQLLAELGCARAQGHLFAPALPAQTFELLLRRADGRVADIG